MMMMNECDICVCVCAHVCVCVCVCVREREREREREIQLMTNEIAQELLENGDVTCEVWMVRLLIAII